jgi:hypothetical protein
MSRSLQDFCETMLVLHGRPEAVEDDGLAQHFVQFYGLSASPDLEEIRLLLDEYHHVACIQPGQLGGLSAYHYRDRRRRLNIEYAATDWQGRTEFSIVHECYEAIHEGFEELEPGYHAQRSSSNLCMNPRSDKFAAAVLMQPEVFTAAIMETGLDMCSLRRYFRNRYYASVAIRTRELFRPPFIAEDVDFMIAIYDRNGNGDPQQLDLFCCPEDFYVSCLVKTPGIRLSKSKAHANFKSYLWPRRLFSVVGEEPAPGFIVDEVINEDGPVYYQEIRFDLLGANAMSLLARPVHWFGRLAKIIVVAVRQKDSYLLEKQLFRLPWSVKRDPVHVS